MPVKKALESLKRGGVETDVHDTRGGNALRVEARLGEARTG